MIMGEVQTEHKEKGKAAHDKGERSDRREGQTKIRQNRRKRERLRMIRGRGLTEEKDKQRSDRTERKGIGCA
jgi:hypothetical protein